MGNRHITAEQRDNISAELQSSTTGAVVVTAPASDKEAISYEGEIASVLEDKGFKVEVDNTERKTPEYEIPTGLEMTIADETIRPGHAYQIVYAFRRAGVALTTSIKAKWRKNNTLYITVGPNDSPTVVPQATRTAATSRWRPLAALIAKWKMKRRRA